MDSQFFEKPILNSPYDYPARHWELDESGEWRKLEAGDEPRSVQRELMLGHQARAQEAQQQA